MRRLTRLGRFGCNARAVRSPTAPTTQRLRTRWREGSEIRRPCSRQDTRRQWGRSRACPASARSHPATVVYIRELVDVAGCEALRLVVTRAPAIMEKVQGIRRERAVGLPAEDIVGIVDEGAPGVVDLGIVARKLQVGDCEGYDGFAWPSSSEFTLCSKRFGQEGRSSRS